MQSRHDSCAHVVDTAYRSLSSTLRTTPMLCSAYSLKLSRYVQNFRNLLLLCVLRAVSRLIKCGYEGRSADIFIV